MNRKEFLKTLGFGVAAAGAGETLLTSCMNHDMEAMNAIAPTVQEGAFTTPLPFPKTATSGTALKAGTQTQTILQGKSATVLGYNEGMLGPIFGLSVGYRSRFLLPIPSPKRPMFTGTACWYPPLWMGIPINWSRPGSPFPIPLPWINRPQWPGTIHTPT